LPQDSHDETDFHAEGVIVSSRSVEVAAATDTTGKQ
jgi:hypothetical protein